MLRRQNEALTKQRDADQGEIFRLNLRDEASAKRETALRGKLKDARQGNRVLRNKIQRVEQECADIERPYLQLEEDLQWCPRVNSISTQERKKWATQEGRRRCQLSGQRKESCYPPFPFLHVIFGHHSSRNENTRVCVPQALDTVCVTRHHPRS